MTILVGEREAVPDGPASARSSPSVRSGACIWLTGLSGAGKTTTAEIIGQRLTQAGRRVTMLDGDVVRTHLSKGLGFSKEDRDTNVRRIGFVAREIVGHGGIVVCATVSPYRGARDEVRAMLGADFIEVYVDTPIEICEERDSKGLYAKARRGEIAAFTGVSDPYEAPPRPELVLTTIDRTPEANAELVIGELRGRGLLD